MAWVPGAALYGATWGALGRITAAAASQQGELCDESHGNAAIVSDALGDRTATPTARERLRVWARVARCVCARAPTRRRRRQCSPPQFDESLSLLLLEFDTGAGCGALGALGSSSNHRRRRQQQQPPPPPPSPRCRAQRQFSSSGARQQQHEHQQHMHGHGQQQHGQQHDQGGPRALYDRGLADGTYRPDPRQSATVDKLQAMFSGLRSAYRRPSRPSGLTIVDSVAVTQPKSSWLDGLSSLLTQSSGGGNVGMASSSAASAPGGSAATRPKGLYMYGGVGCGKTMLMDVFVKSCPPDFRVRRVHFHDFMLDVHSRLRAHKGEADPLRRVADELVAANKVRGGWVVGIGLGLVGLVWLGGVVSGR